MFPKNTNYLLKLRFGIKKFQVLSDIKTKILKRVRFQIKLSTMLQILKQNFHNVSDFKSKFYNVSGFVLKIFKKNSDFEEKCAFKKSRFD